MSFVLIERQVTHAQARPVSLKGENVFASILKIPAESPQSLLQWPAQKELNGRLSFRSGYLHRAAPLRCLQVESFIGTGD